MGSRDDAVSGSPSETKEGGIPASGTNPVAHHGETVHDAGSGGPRQRSSGGSLTADSKGNNAPLATPPNSVAVVSGASTVVPDASPGVFTGHVDRQQIHIDHNSPGSRRSSVSGFADKEPISDTSSHGKRGNRPSRFTFGNSIKSLFSAASVHPLGTRSHSAQSGAAGARGQTMPQGLKLSTSMLAPVDPPKEGLRNRTCMWFLNHIRNESFFAVYSVWTLRKALILCTFGCIFFLALGICFLVLNEQHIECKLNYEEYSLGDGGTRYECLPITGDFCGAGRTLKELKGPDIWVYYELESFYQNDAQVLWSRNDRQLAGHIFTDPADVKDCEPLATKVVDNVTKVLHPCGAMAWNVFQDNYLFFDTPPDGPAGHGSVKPLALRQSQSDILEPSTWKGKFKNPPADERAATRDKVYFWMSVVDNDDGNDVHNRTEEGHAWLMHESLNYDEAGEMVENAHFIQWMRPAALPTFRKLYGKLQGPLQLPLYAYIAINFDVKPWGGKKAIILVQPSAFRGQTLFMGISYVVFGCILLLLVLYLLWRMKQSKDETQHSDIRWRLPTKLSKGKRKDN